MQCRVICPGNQRTSLQRRAPPPLLRPISPQWLLGKKHRILPKERLMHGQICTLSCTIGLLIESWRCNETVLPWQHNFHSFGNAQWLPSWNCAWAGLEVLFSLPGIPLPVVAVFSMEWQEIFENHCAYRNSDLCLQHTFTADPRSSVSSKIFFAHK